MLPSVPAIRPWSEGLYLHCGSARLDSEEAGEKIRDELVKEMFYFGLKTHADVAGEIDRLSANVKGTIIFSTLNAHQCEVRQCINRFGLDGTRYLVHLYHTDKACKNAADDVMRAMAEGTWNKSGCFAVMVLDAVVSARSLTIKNVKDLAKKWSSRGSQPTVSPRDVVRSMAALSPKLCLEGIPEWVALRGNLDLLISRCSNSYHGFYKAAKSLGIRVNKRSGRRLSKPELRKCIAAHLGAYKDMATLPKKRSWYELEAGVIAGGGKTRLSDGGRRRRLDKGEMIAWLEQPAELRKRPSAKS